MDRYNVYVGARYIPIFSGDWDNTKKYEPLEIVSYQGDSYTSKTYVPTGIDITNETYWAKTGNYNAQVEQLYHQVVNMGDKVDNLDLNVQELSENIQGYDTHFTEIDSHLGALDTRCNNIEQRITNEVTRIDGVTDNLDNKIDTEVERLENEISQLQSGGFVTPEMYGAVGDGVTADNTALNQCFAHASQNNLIVLGIGTYLIDGSTNIVCDSGITVFNLRLHFSDNGSNFGKEFKVTEHNYYFINCTFEDIGTATISGLEFVKTGGDVNTTWVTNCGDIIFDNCKFINSGYMCISIGSTFDNTLYINNCYFSSKQVGVYFRSRNIVVENTDFEALGTDGFLQVMSTEMNSGSERTLRNITLNNVKANTRILNLQQAYRSDFDTVIIADCVDTNSSINNKSIYSTGDDNHFSSFNQLIVDNSILNTVDINFLYTASGSKSGVQIKNSHVGTIDIATSDNIIISGCELGYVGSTTNENIIIQDCFFYIGSSGCITTYLKPWEASTQKIKNIFLNNVIFDTHGMNTGALIEDVAVEKVICNGVSFRDENASMQFMDNTSQVLTSYLYMDGVQSYELRASGKYFVKGVTGVIIRGIGASDSYTISGATRQKVETTWFST